MKDIDEQMKAALAQLDLYYEQSFRVTPEECNPQLYALAGIIEKIAPQLKPEQTLRLNELLGMVVNAMGKGDTVLTRDFLHYELKPFLGKLR